MWIVVNPTEIIVWAQAGNAIFQIGKSTVSEIRAAVQSDPAADLTKLDELDADYDRRITRREEPLSD